jgi:hypothetical protein
VLQAVAPACLHPDLHVTAAAAAAAVLQALAPSLLELRLAALDAPATGHQDLLFSLTASLPDMKLSGLCACPTLVSIGGALDIAEHFIIPYEGHGSLTLLRSEDPSPQPLSTAFLTRLNLMDFRPGLHRQPLLFQAAFTTQIRHLHLNFWASPEAHVVQVAALPPHLTNI